MYSQNQQQQQQPQSGASTWNGSQWVAIAPSTPFAPMTYMQSQPSQNPQVINANLVQLYTQYYHQWTALHAEYSKNPTMGSEAQWAKYYADLASRAAHYFHANPTIVAASSDFALPPVPPVTVSTNATASIAQASTAPTLHQPVNPFNASVYLNHNPSNQQQQQVIAPEAKNSEGNASDKMKRYVDRCLSQYNNTPENKAKVMKQIQQQIMLEIRNGSLNSVDWDNKRLVELSADEAVKSASHSDRQDAKYCGPSPNASAEYLKGNKNRKVNRNELHRRGSTLSSSSNTNYYGPTSETNALQLDDDKNDSEDFISVPSYNKSIVSKKRKKAVLETGFTQSDSVLSSRANRFAGKGGLQHNDAITKNSSGEWDRFMGKSAIGGTKEKLDETDYENMTIRGTCQILEKDYLRLTAPPRAELVRPLPILKQHLQNLKVECANKNRDYLWYCSQLKAIRQDCIVQRIQNAFTVDVYEMHARIALEENDLNEYNQCQTQLKELYLSFYHCEDDEEKEVALQNQNEFVAYRLLYYVVLAMESHKHGSSSDIFKIMLSLTHQQLNDQIIKHALAVREACCSGILDYCSFFRLWKETSNVGASHMKYLMDRIVSPIRYEALNRICKAYRPTLVPIDLLYRSLGLEDGSAWGLSWLQSCGCVFTEDGLQLNTKETIIHDISAIPKDI
jgi:SAC3 family protein LENG8/THP3